MRRTAVLLFTSGALVTTSCKTRTFQSGGGARFNIAASAEVRQEFAAKPPFDVNDASVLIPLNVARNVDAFAMSKYVKTADLGAIVAAASSPEMKKFLEAAKGKGQDITAPGFGSPGAGNDFTVLDKWRIMSYRIDTCAPGPHFITTVVGRNEAQRDGACKVQLRLIAQPLLGEAKQDADFTLHLLYDLGQNVEQKRTAIDNLLRSMDAVRLACGGCTAGKPLGTHPGLDDVSSGAGRATLEEITKFLDQFAQPAALQSVAVMALASGSPEPWFFYAMVRGGSDKQLTLQPIPTVDLPGDTSGNNKSHFQALSFLTEQHVLGEPSKNMLMPAPGGPVPVPRPEGVEGIKSTKAILDRRSFDPTDIGPLSELDVNDIHLIDSPKVHAFFQLDCVSCHTTGNLLMRRMAALSGNAEDKKELSLLQSGVIKDRFRVPAGITGYARASEFLPNQASFGRPWSVRNFGYFNGIPTINTRTVSETAEVVEDINVEVLGKTEAGPNPCQRFAGDPDWNSTIEPALYTCMTFGRAPTGGKSLAQECFEKFCPAVSSNPPSVQPTVSSVPTEPVCKAAPTVFKDGESFFVILEATEKRDDEARSRAIVLSGSAAPQAGVTFAKRLDFVHGTNTSGETIRSTLDVTAAGPSITLQQRAERNDFPFAVWQNKQKVTLTWTCNHWEGTVAGRRLAMAPANEKFSFNAQAAVITPVRPIEIPRNLGASASGR